MVDDNRIFGTIGSLYDCVPEPDLWPAVLGDITEMTDGVLATLAVLDTSRQETRFSAAFGDPAMLEPLFTTYAAHMPFYSILHRFELGVPVDFDGLCTLYGPDGYDVWYGSLIYGEWVKPNRLRTGLNLLVMRRDNLIGAFNTLTADDKPSTRASLALLSNLAPHIRRAVTIGDLFEAELRNTRVFQQVIDNLSHAVVIVGSDMSILYANAAAEILLRDETSIKQTSGRLAISYPPADASVAHAVELGHREEFLLGTAGIDVPLVKTERPSVAHVLPLNRRASASRIAANAAAAVFIAAPGSNPVPAIEAIAALFGLSATEKKVASLVASGKTRGEIAAAHGVSDHTVKTQLGVIYDKTGTRDQRQLQSLMHELTPPVRPCRLD